MKKEDIIGFIVYLIIFAFAIVFGLLVLREHAGHSQLGNLYILYIIGAIVSGVLFNSILCELGHVVGAKLGGYKILSVNVLGFMFCFDGSKKKFRFKNFDGLTGETKIAPTEGKKNNPSLYLMMSTIFFAIEAVAFVVLFMFLKSNDAGKSAQNNTAYFFLVMVVIGAMMLVYNIIPFRLDSMNDGYRLKLISNPKNKEAFNELLRVQYAVENGQENVEIKTFEDITNFTAELNLNKVYILQDQGKLDEAEKMLDDILASNDISYTVYIRAKSQKIYIHLMNNDPETAKVFYDEQVPMNERREISEDISMPSIRAYILMSGLLDDSQSETMRSLNHVLKAYKRTSESRQKFELKLYNEALNKVIAKHPKWELEGYLLEEKK